MTKMICPKADKCTVAEGCGHAEYHTDSEWCYKSVTGVNGYPACMTREEAERDKEIADAEDKGFDLEVNRGKL